MLRTFVRIKVKLYGVQHNGVVPFEFHKSIKVILHRNLVIRGQTSQKGHLHCRFIKFAPVSV